MSLYYLVDRKTGEFKQVRHQGPLQSQEIGGTRIIPVPAGVEILEHPVDEDHLLDQIGDGLLARYPGFSNVHVWVPSAGAAYNQEVIGLGVSRFSGMASLSTTLPDTVGSNFAVYVSVGALDYSPDPEAPQNLRMVYTDRSTTLGPGSVQVVLDGSPSLTTISNGGVWLDSADPTDDHGVILNLGFTYVVHYIVHLWGG